MRKLSNLTILLFTASILIFSCTTKIESPRYMVIQSNSDVSYILDTKTDSVYTLWGDAPDIYRKSLFDVENIKKPN